MSELKASEDSARLSSLLRYARPHWRIAISAGFGMALEASVAAAFTYLMKHMLDDVFVAQDAGVARWLPWIILAMFAVRALGVYIGDIGAAKIARSIVRDLRQRCFEHYLRLPTSFFAANDPGPLTARISNEVEQLGHACTEGFKIILADSLMLLGLLGVMLATSVKLTLTVLIVGPLIGLIVSTVSKRYRRLSRGIQDSIGALTGRAQTVIAGERDVKLYGASAQEAAQFATINQHNYRQQLKVTATNALSTSIVQFLAACALALVVFVAAMSARSGAKGMSPGEFMSFISAMLLILPSLKRLTGVQNLIGRGVAAAASVEALLAHTPEPAGGPRHLNPATLRGELRFAAVALYYPGAGRAAVSDINLTLRPGTITALVGRSGGGKTTLAQLLARLIEPTEGKILLDGIPITDYALSSYRQQIAWVGQHVMLNAGTVLENVAYGQRIPEELPERIAFEQRAWDALAAAQAKDFVHELPGELYGLLGSNGATLSGGQRQRLALARAIFKRGKILILDEATSALDNSSERAVQQALQALRENTTTLVIAHRLSTIEHADHIVVLDEGRIVEQGRHSELLSNAGVYAELHQQFTDVPVI